MTDVPLCCITGTRFLTPQLRQCSDCRTDSSLDSPSRAFLSPSFFTAVCAQADCLLYLLYSLDKLNVNHESEVNFNLVEDPMIKASGNTFFKEQLRRFLNWGREATGKEDFKGASDQAFTCDRTTENLLTCVLYRCRSVDASKVA